MKCFRQGAVHLCPPAASPDAGSRSAQKAPCLTSRPAPRRNPRKRSSGGLPRHMAPLPEKGQWVGPEVLRTPSVKGESLIRG